MNITKKLLLTAVFSCLSYSAPAQTTFSFHDTSNTVGTGSVFSSETGEVQDTRDSFTMTAEAFLDEVSTGTFFNGATTAFGINANGSGDETQHFDDDNGTESMVFSFGSSGTFTQLDLVGINITNEATLSFEGGSTYHLSSSTDDIYNFNEHFTAGQLITLMTNAAGANFGLESLTVVPEPNKFATFAGCFALAMVMYRRHRLK